MTVSRSHVPRPLGAERPFRGRLASGAGRVLGAAAVCSAVALVACAEPEADDGEAPAYSEPGYASAPGGDVETELRLTEVGLESGIDFVHTTGAFGEKWMPETMGSGAAFLDYDGDGDPDLFLVNSDWWPGHELDGERPTQRLYRNLGAGRFEDVTREAGLALSFYGMGVAAGDYDGDGDPDLYVTAVGPNRLLRNDDGRFIDVTARAGVSGDPPDGPPAWSTGAAWVDADVDGWPDLFVCNYVRWTPETDLFATIDGTTKSYATPQQYQGESCRLYRNRGDGRFEDVTARAGLHNPEGKSLGVAVGDLDESGWPDLVVANDTQRNFLYMNDGDGTFTDVAVRAGVAFDEVGRARAGMGVDVADLTGEGAWSIAIGNFAHEPLALFTEIGESLFQDRAGAAKLTRSTLVPLTFGVAFADFDLDGALDLIAANGHIEPGVNAVQQDQTFAQRPQLFLGDGQGGFADVGAQLGGDFAEAVVGRGVATADVDGDGDLDLLVTVNGGRPRLFRNDLPTGRSIAVRVQGGAPNTGALGALVTVRAGGRVQRRVVATGSSYLSQSALQPLRFGLGELEAADEVVVRWGGASGETRSGPVAAGDTVTLRPPR